MTLILNSFVFLFGLIIGSFLNCVIYRLEKGKSFLKGRSFCPQCKHLLGFFDLIPLLSFSFLRGKCRYCKKIISWQYPIVEISTALIFLLIFNYQFAIYNQFSITNFQNFLNFAYLLIVSCFLLIIFVFDFKHYIIPDEVIFPAIILSLIFNLQFAILNGLQSFGPAIFSASAAAGFFLAIVLISKGKWMGIGDIKLAFLMGLILSWPNILVALLFAFWSGALVGIILIIFRKKKLRSEIPFGPFLIGATFAALFLGEKIISWYLNLIRF